MASNNKAVRIIKREHRNHHKTKTPAVSRTAKQDHRAMTKTVTLWIAQQKDKKELEWRGSF